jgi:hypothetical protein
MDIANILTTKFPGAVWVLDGDDYSGLNWQDDSPKPTKKQLEILWPEVQLEIERKAIKEIRKSAYQYNSDPLFFGWQRGDNTEQEWLDSVQSVKNCYPYPQVD